jgi:hypothetical protein
MNSWEFACSIVIGAAELVAEYEKRVAEAQPDGVEST